MKKTYPVLTAIEHGTTAKSHKRYEPGSTIDLEDDDATPLIAVNAIGDPIEQSAADTTGQK